MKKRRSDQQLYSLVRRLALVIEREQELGEAVAYVVLNSLLNFDSNSGSPEERQFEQVKAVHQGLEGMVVSAQQKGIYNALCEIRTPVDGLFQNYLQDQSVEIGQSEIVQGTFARLSDRFSKNYEDRLRRDGSGLYHQVLARNEIKGRKNTLIHDYNTLKEAFVEGLR